ncbi:siderophore-interacting protein [Novosphingobium sp.]|uniref:siderophore-interacting protein n=1 Tax=Novosphingobium sp. TaxID=1874826 RepID=UPI0031E34405
MKEQPVSPKNADRQLGVISKALIRLLMRNARVSACESLGSRFRLITLEGEELRHVSWSAGEKIQISLGSAFTNRTYTPLNWDAPAGTTRILVFAHGEGPGSAWALNVKVGDPCHLFGPRRSLDPSSLPANLILFGDETSLGLAKALQETRQPGTLRTILEVDSVDETGSVVTALALQNVELITRGASNTQTAAEPTDMDCGFLLTGKAQSIQVLRTDLKARGIPVSSIITKAYWAPGKRGLD